MKFWIHAGKQLVNCWRNQIAIGLELVLVLGVTWYMVDYLFVQVYNMMLPNGRDLSDCYKVKMMAFPEEDPAYRQEDADPESVERDMRRVIERIAAYPGVQTVGVGISCSSEPYSGCYNGAAFTLPQDSTREASFMKLAMDPQYDYLGVFHYQTPDGQIVKNADFDWSDPKSVLISRKVEQDLFGEETPVGSSVGKLVKQGDYETYVVKGVLRDIKRFDNRLPEGMAVFPYNTLDTDYSILYFRVDPRMAGAAFEERFRKEMSQQLQIGNLYLYECCNYEQLRSDMNLTFGFTYDWNIRLALLLFLGLNILLCVMGTFWYRVNQRRGEIGLRMALGASRSSVRGLLLREGICLLVLATPLAVFIEMQLAVAGFVDLSVRDVPVGYLPAIGWIRFLISNLSAWTLVALIISLAVWFPATRAAKEDPALALRQGDE
ncbi:MAG: ABC transporter permease [Parabacteroides sp.]